ncbi:MAG: trehalose-phosphatase [Rhodospirillaceae bacterium]|nr:trehalose-phosphatase [Rhodospirillaceae bacterium]
MGNRISHPPPLTADTALFLDFDGTLVDIARTPEDIRVAEDLGHLLGSVSDALHGALAVISGRPIDAVDRFLGGAVRAVAGVHGATRRDARGMTHGAPADATALKDYRPILESFAHHHTGILLEDKTISIAVHFREAPELAEESRQIVADCAAASQGRLEFLEGKMVAELKPARITKAGALSAYMNEAPFQGRRPVFAGDDITDEAGFSAVAKVGGYGVIVGERTPTAATARLASVADLHQWLKVFCAAGAA